MNFQKIKTDGQYFIPKHLLTILVGFLAKRKLGKITQLMINAFIKNYHINIKEIVGKPNDYKTFNDFFARPLKPSARAIDAQENTLVFPVDGKISQFGNIEKNFIIQAKNHYYTVDSLLANDVDSVKFKNGDFITIYLSPTDYHRVHIPFGGTLTKMIHVPGDLFSVNTFNAENIPELFARNERVICLFDTDIGKMAVVFVGATIVRSIATAWAGTVAPNKNKKISTWDYTDKNISFAKGDEIGKFFMGSTVICLFEKDKIQFSQDLQCGQSTKMGALMSLKKDNKKRSS